MNISQNSVVIILIFLLISSSVSGIVEAQPKSTDKAFRFHFQQINNRFILWAQPNQPVPEGGYPVIFLFHGAVQHAFSWILGWNKWNKEQMIFQETALQQGYFIVLCESQRPIWPGPRAWDVFTKNTSENRDLHYIKHIRQYLEANNYPINTHNMFCTGFSSGAFMCSRIAINENELFNAIVLNSGCNADRINLTDRGPVFILNTSINLSEHHPPTLLLHGNSDQLVPVSCAIQYQQDLQAAGVQCDLIIDTKKGHIWLSEYNQAILDWFNHFIE